MAFAKSKLFEASSQSMIWLPENEKKYFEDYKVSFLTFMKIADKNKFRSFIYDWSFALLGTYVHLYEITSMCD